MSASRPQEQRQLLAEWIAGAIGVLITLVLLGFIAARAFDPRDPVPEITINVRAVEPTAGGFVVAFTARNGSSRAAAEVEVEGTLSRAGSSPVVSKATLDYVPGHSTRSGGLFFKDDPRGGDLQLRPVGFADP